MEEIYIYKKEIDWSALTDGITLPVDYINTFGTIKHNRLKRGESKEVTIYVGGYSYKAKITNVNYNPKFNRKKDTLQIRHSKVLASFLQNTFSKSYEYIKKQRTINNKIGSRKMIKLPHEYKDYIAIYATKNDYIFSFEPILAEDILISKTDLFGIGERAIENSFNYFEKDDSVNIMDTWNKSKIRKLNRKIAERLKIIYDFRCQICNRLIGEKHGAQSCESHHIEYFCKSFNNDSTNQIILCPNHHSIIHEVNPTFDRRNLMFKYNNGYEEKIVLDKHLHLSRN